MQDGIALKMAEWGDSFCVWLQAAGFDGACLPRGSSVLHLGTISHVMGNPDVCRTHSNSCADYTDVCVIILVSPPQILALTVPSWIESSPVQCIGTALCFAGHGSCLVNVAGQECSSLGLCVLMALGALVMLKMESAPKLIGTPVGFWGFHQTMGSSFCVRNVCNGTCTNVSLC